MIGIVAVAALAANAASTPPAIITTQRWRTKISRYGTLKTWANELGLGDEVGLLDQTLAEEKKTDATLTEIAESVVNAEAEAA
jgi:ferritin-like metal-binding protein YciE